MAWDPSSGKPQPPFVPFEAIWDTGATQSAITQKVVDACGLIPTGIYAGGLRRTCMNC